MATSSVVLILVMLSTFTYGEYDNNHLDPDVNRNASQLITSKGYPCEVHTVQTKDGFLLTAHRIPHGLHNQDSTKKRPVAFLQHGLLGSSTNWITNRANQSLAYILADAGYDVWMGNTRGNTYSRRHVKYSPDQDQFWAWSWDQIAEYDLPALITFALEKSGEEQLYYIGHSQGSTIGFARFSQDPVLAKKIRLFIAYGPVTTVGRMESPLRLLAYMTQEIQDLFKIFGWHSFLPNNAIMKFFGKTFCAKPLTRVMCENIMFLLGGYDAKEMNITRLPVYVSHCPAGTSVQNMVHFGQMVRSGVMQMYDFGSESENRKHYNQTSAPLYHPEKMTIPVVLYSGGNDWLADPKDVKLLTAKLPNLLGNYVISYYEHMDFIWGLNAANLVYGKTIDIMKQHPVEE